MPGLALAQTDYSAGKTPAQLFAGDCSACHKTPRGLAKGRDARTLATFLREHYTTKSQSAGLLASYLLSNPTPPASAAAEAASANPDGRKPGDRTQRGKKPDPAELAREAAKQAEEATKAKVRGYAIAGETARPFVAADQVPAAPEAAPEPAAPPPAADSAPAEQAPTSSEAKPAGEERPAATPPG